MVDLEDEGKGVASAGMEWIGSDLSSLEETTPRGKCCEYFILRQMLVDIIQGITPF